MHGKRHGTFTADDDRRRAETRRPRQIMSGRAFVEKLEKARTAIVL